MGGGERGRARRGGGEGWGIELGAAERQMGRGLRGFQGEVWGLCVLPPSSRFASVFGIGASVSSVSPSVIPSLLSPLLISSHPFVSVPVHLSSSPVSGFIPTPFSPLCPCLASAHLSEAPHFPALLSECPPHPFPISTPVHSLAQSFSPQTPVFPPSAMCPLSPSSVSSLRPPVPLCLGLFVSRSIPTAPSLFIP